MMETTAMDRCNAQETLLAQLPSNLDSYTAGQVFGLFEKMAGSGKTIVMVTHDDELAARMPRMVAIADGRIVEDSGALARAPALALA